MINRLEIEGVSVDSRVDVWRTWSVSWTGVWVGMLTSLAGLVVLGLVGVAIGSHLIGPSPRILSWREFGILALAFSVASSFFSFVAGGWVAARVAGIRRAEPAMLHGAIAWLVVVPALVVLVATGGNSLLGPWYGGLASAPAWTKAPAPKPAVSAEDEAAKKEAEDAARATRNSALGAVTALLLGLLGSVIGSWMASGEPMHFAHYSRPRTTPETTAIPART